MPALSFTRPAAECKQKNEAYDTCPDSLQLNYHPDVVAALQRLCHADTGYSSPAKACGGLATEDLSAAISRSPLGTQGAKYLTAVNEALRRNASLTAVKSYLAMGDLQAAQARQTDDALFNAQWRMAQRAVRLADCFCYACLPWPVPSPCSHRCAIQHALKKGALRLMSHMSACAYSAQGLYAAR